VDRLNSTAFLSESFWQKNGFVSHQKPLIPSSDVTGCNSLQFVCELMSLTVMQYVISEGSTFKLFFLISAGWLS